MFMAVKKAIEQKVGNRQAAYSARNKARLIQDAKMVLAEIGPSATIEQIASHAEVSPTTIYKYFENKDQLFLEAFGEEWASFVRWASLEMRPGDMLEITLDTGRKLFWAKKSHPLFANMLHNYLSQMSVFPVLADKGESKKVFKALAAAGDLRQEEFEKRWVLWTNLYAGLVKSIYVSEDLSPSEAEVAFGIGLSIWGISETKAKKLISRPLNFAPVESNLFK
jgi:AcrR family transcriptional regulator